MKKLISLLLLIVLTSLFTQCTKTVCNDYTIPLSIDNYTLNYFGSFGQGSYWIYHDSLGDVDSTYVISYSRSGGTTEKICYQTGFEEKKPTYPTDQATTVMHSSKNDSFEFKVQSYGAEILGLDTHFSFSMANEGYSSNILAPLLSPYDTSVGLRLTLLTGSGTNLSGIIEVYSIHPNNYLPVYFAPYGITQKRIHGVPYNLVRYKIVRG